MKFYCKRGSRYQIYFCICPWVQTSLARYIFEKLILNPCLATHTELKARGFDLYLKIQSGAFSRNDEDEFETIQQLVGL